MAEQTSGKIKFLTKSSYVLRSDFKVSQLSLSQVTYSKVLLFTGKIKTEKKNNNLGTFQSKVIQPSSLKPCIPGSKQ